MLTEQEAMALVFSLGPVSVEKQGCFSNRCTNEESKKTYIISFFHYSFHILGKFCKAMKAENRQNISLAFSVNGAH